ncbi:MAG: SIS domain-containing protein [Bacteroidota bacterium]
MEKLSDFIEKEIAALQAIPLDGGIEAAVSLIHQQVHLQHGKVVVSGVGKAGLVGQLLATTLCSTGTAACFLNPLEAQHGDLGVLQANDILLCISNSGQTRELLELTELARRMYPDLKLVVMTRNAESPLARAADVALLTGHTHEICPLELTPTTSTTVMKVIVDLLVVQLMEKINFTKDMYAMRHHGGYLGKKSKQ